MNLTEKTGFKLVYGNEGINSIFRIGKENNHFKNDYNQTIAFLKNLEKKKKNPFNLFRFKNLIVNSLVFLMKKTGTFEVVRKIQHSIKYK